MKTVTRFLDNPTAKKYLLYYVARRAEKSSFESYASEHLQYY